MSRLFLAGDNPSFLAMLRDLFEAHLEFSLCGQAQTGAGAISKAAQLEPSLIILDFGDSFTEGLHTAKELREKLSNTQLLLVTGDHGFYAEKAATLCEGHYSPMREQHAAWNLLQREMMMAHNADDSFCMLIY